MTNSNCYQHSWRASIPLQLPGYFPLPAFEHNTATAAYGKDWSTYKQWSHSSQSMSLCIDFWYWGGWIANNAGVGQCTLCIQSNISHGVWRNKLCKRKGVGSCLRDLFQHTKQSHLHKWTLRRHWCWLKQSTDNLSLFYSVFWIL